MKKTNVFKLLFASVSMMLGFSSCNKCVECKAVGYSSYSTTICKEEHYTNKAWNNILDEYEDNGYDCDPL
jgi:hypothetical protein